MHADKQQQELDQRMANLQEWLGRIDRTYQPTHTNEGLLDIVKFGTKGAKAAGAAADAAKAGRSVDDASAALAAAKKAGEAERAAAAGKGAADAAKVDRAASAEKAAQEYFKDKASTDPKKAGLAKRAYDALPGWAKGGAAAALTYKGAEALSDIAGGLGSIAALQALPGGDLGDTASTEPMDAEKLKRLQQAEPETRVIPQNESHIKGTNMSTELYKPVELSRLMELAGMTNEADDREAAMGKLSAKQKEWLGGADPTDPFIMARLKKAVPDEPVQTATPAVAAATIDANRPMGAAATNASQAQAMGTAPTQQPAATTMPAATPVAQRISPEDDYAQAQAPVKTATPARKPTVAAQLAADRNAAEPTYPARAATQTATPAVTPTPTPTPAAAASSRQDFGKGVKDTIAGAVKSIGATPISTALGYTPIGMAAKGIGAAADFLNPVKASEKYAQSSRDFDAAQAAKGAQTATPAAGQYVGMEESRDSLARMRELAGMKK